MRSHVAVVERFGRASPLDRVEDLSYAGKSPSGTAARGSNIFLVRVGP
jgi:hypothetical protein